MPTITVTSDPNRSGGRAVTLEERVVSAHLEDAHSAAQLIERLGWAILDAEEVGIAGIAREASPSDRFQPRPASERLRLSERALAA